VALLYAGDNNTTSVGVEAKDPENEGMIISQTMSTIKYLTNLIIPRLFKFFLDACLRPKVGLLEIGSDVHKH
jgi:hypothetical protein